MAKAMEFIARRQTAEAFEEQGRVLKLLNAAIKILTHTAGQFSVQ
jgi:hypothetical protein